MSFSLAELYCIKPYKCAHLGHLATDRKGGREGGREGGGGLWDEWHGIVIIGGVDNVLLQERGRGGVIQDSDESQYEGHEGGADVWKCWDIRLTLLPIRVSLLAFLSLPSSPLLTPPSLHSCPGPLQAWPHCHPGQGGRQDTGPELPDWSKALRGQLDGAAEPGLHCQGPVC